MGIADDILRRGNRTPTPQPTPPQQAASEILSRPPTPFQPETTRQDTQDTARDHGFGRAPATPGSAALEDGELIAGVDASGNKQIIAIATDAPTGTESAQVTRPIIRKKTVIESQAALLANGVFTGAWHDSELDGTIYVQSTMFADQISAVNGWAIQESDDILNANFTRTVIFFNPSTPINTVSKLSSRLTSRYWRVVYTNGATAQKTFELTSCSMSFPQNSGANSASVTDPFNVVIAGICTGTTIADGVLNSQSSEPIAANPNSGASVSSNGPLVVMPLVYNGTSWDRPRTPNIFKQNSTAATGSTALWTPTAGKKFRLMRFRVQVTALAKAAAAADLTIALLDAAASVHLETIVTIPAAALTAGDDYDSGWIDLGNGILSAAANNVLNLNLSFALTGGLVNVNVCGTEE